jgi:23S rRNA (cytosine1962-C5)-methyltransferase
MKKARRYQLRKDAVLHVQRGHPWIFREQMSTAASVLTDGEWLRLVDGQNQVVGHGIYEAEGAIAIRVLRTGPELPDAAWARETLRTAIAKRAELAPRTNAIRLLHGESDRIPAVVADRFADTLVVASYSAGTDGLARYTARALTAEVSGIVGVIKHVLLRPARRRHGPVLSPRALVGAPPDVVHFTEDGLAFAVDLAAGHKTGTYLDLRGLRRALATSNLAGARVLNLFAYSGMLGRAVEAAGAASITQVDASERALAFAAAHHVTDASKHQFITADVFEWLPALAAGEQYDVVICDPPAMTSRKQQVPSVLAAYRKLYKAAEQHVKPGGLLVSACCTSRVERAVFKQTVRQSLPERFKLERDIPPEPDHPVGFPQADYLKILLWRASA